MEVPKNQIYEGNQVISVTVNQSNEVTSSLQMIPFSIESGSNGLNTNVFLDGGPMVSIIDKR